MVGLWDCVHCVCVFVEESEKEKLDLQCVGNRRPQSQLVEELQYLLVKTLGTSSLLFSVRNLMFQTLLPLV